MVLSLNGVATTLQVGDGAVLLAQPSQHHGQTVYLLRFTRGIAFMDLDGDDKHLVSGLLETADQMLRFCTILAATHGLQARPDQSPFAGIVLQVTFVH